MEDLFKAGDEYIEQLFPCDNDVINAVADAITASGIPDMSVSPVQGRFLYVLAKLCNARHILEVGTFLGYSTVWLAKALPDGGKLITIEADEHHAALAMANISNAGYADKVSLRIGKALDILPQLTGENAGTFDMIFIDADKPPYAEYFEWALKLSRPGTLIVADNVIRHHFDNNTNAEKKAGVEQFNKLLASCTEVTATIIQNVGVKEHDGMAIAVVN